MDRLQTPTRKPASTRPALGIEYRLFMYMLLHVVATLADVDTHPRHWHAQLWQPRTLFSCCVLLADLDMQTVEQLYPSQLAELSPGSFTYTYMLTITTSKSIYLAVDASVVGRVNVSNIQHVPPTIDMFNTGTPLVAGQPVNLQLNSSVTDFASLAASSTGWRVELLRPDNSSVDLGMMTAWEVWSGVVYKWSMIVPGYYTQQVRLQYDTQEVGLARLC
jgi:hypothetical protein